MQLMALPSKLLTTLLITLMVLPSWMMRDCCCTRRASAGEQRSCCKQQLASSNERVSPCCAARVKANSQSRPKCQPASTCRCRSVQVVASLSMSRQIERVLDHQAYLWSRAVSPAVDYLAKVSTIGLSVVDPDAGIRGPDELCIRLCRWLA